MMSAVIPKISYLSKCIIRVLGCNPGPMTLQGTNTYIIGTGKRRVLFDTGEKSNEEYLSNLTHVLKENDIKLGTIIISHWHHDHIGGLEEVLHLNSDSEIAVLKFPRNDAVENVTSLATTRMRWLEGGDEIKVEGATIRVHHTPGHTTDHVVLKLEEEGAVFSGDCILGEGTAVFEDLYHYMKSLQDILELHPAVVYPGHGPVITNPTHKIQYYIDHRNQRETQIMDTFHQNSESELTPLNIVQLVYTDTPEHLHAAAASNVFHHLRKLAKEGKVVCVDEEKSLWRRCGVHSNL